MGLKCIVFSAFCVLEIFSTPFLRDDEPTCGLESCHPIDPDKLNIHFIPHSHDDVGWLKTVDQYYFGSQTDIQRAGVQYIITSTVEALKTNPDRRFIQVETAFFWKWWNRQSDETKQDVINLVNSGQLEIINAAWSMNDEAVTNYQSTIDQFTWGLRFINDTLGSCGIPRIGWQIDPFGHSREQASIFAQLGYDGVFFARLDQKDKENRIANQNMEVIWKGSANLNNTNVFTNAFPDFYSDLNGFCFDIACGDTVMIDDERSPDYNVPARVEEFVGKVNEYAKYYQTNNVLIPMGGDFHYEAAEINFINMDRLIKAFENHDSIKVLYSTPSCYIKAVNEQAAKNNIQFDLKTDDFFPYASGDHQYWTGYFTSRPSAKRFERINNNVLQAAKQLASLSKMVGNDYNSELDLSRRTLGVLQHHDAITGTAKQAVANDYARQLTISLKQSASVISKVLTNFLKKDESNDVNLDLSICRLSNITYCETNKADRVALYVYNPLPRPVQFYVREPVQDLSYRITGPNGEVSYDLFDTISSFDYVNGIDGSPHPKELVFKAENLPPLGAHVYYMEKVDSITKPLQKPKHTKESLRFGTDATNFVIDSDTGLLTQVTSNGVTLDISQEFLYYEGANGDNNGDENFASGAYLFRPINNEATPFVSDPIRIEYAEGELVDEVRQFFHDSITQIIRVYKSDSDKSIEFDYLVGPIQIDDEDSGIGREIISRFTVKDFNSNSEFYTDSNGREIIKRTRNKRYDYEYDSSIEPVASNYYPITSKITIKDEDKKVQVSILTDRAQGGSSLQDGVIELMVHRRLLRDDGKGVGEALNEQEFDQGLLVRGQHLLVIGPTESDSEDKSITALERDLALKFLLPPVVLGSQATDDELSLSNLQDKLNFEFTGLQKNLPDNVHLLTLEPWKDDTYILRLEHFLENGEDNSLSSDVEVDLAGIFNGFEITEIRETTLGANQWLDEYQNKQKFVWNIKEGEEVTTAVTGVVSDDVESLKITLTPMQIRTFIIKVG